jgi:signal transduction histidine kinase
MNQNLLTRVPHSAQTLALSDSRDSAACKAYPQIIEWDDLVHDLRQPLSTIESLAYYLELVCADPKARTHLQQIQELIGQANDILAATHSSNDGLTHAALKP